MEVDTLYAILKDAGVIAGPAGAAWVAVKLSLNGLKEDVKQIRADMRLMSDADGLTRERLARLEGRSLITRPEG